MNIALPLNHGDSRKTNQKFQVLKGFPEKDFLCLLFGCIKTKDNLNAFQELARPSALSTLSKDAEPRPLPRCLGAPKICGKSRNLRQKTLSGEIIGLHPA